MIKKGGRRIVEALVVALGVGLPAGASTTAAQVYVSLQGGASFWADADTTIRAAGGGGTGTSTGRAEYGTGFGAAGAVGYGVQNARFELELSARGADIDRMSGSGGVRVGGVTKTFNGSLSDSDVTAAAALANIWYDVATGTAWRPFAGVGVGVARVNLSIGRTDTGWASDFDDTNTVFAFQGGLGIGYEITPKIMANVSYRYFETSTPNFKATIAGADVTAQTEVKVQTVFAGVLVKF
jgi:opacity protein-like surface antigen